jgi:hypothetical protein
LAEARREEIGISEGTSEEESASTREFADKRVADNASTDRLTIMMSDRAIYITASW